MLARAMVDSMLVLPSGVLHLNCFTSSSIHPYLAQCHLSYSQNTHHHSHPNHQSRLSQRMPKRNMFDALSLNYWIAILI